MSPACQAFSTSQEAGTILDLHHCHQDQTWASRPHFVAHSHLRGELEMKKNRTAEQELLLWEFVMVLGGLYVFRTGKMNFQSGYLPYNHLPSLDKDQML